MSGDIGDEFRTAHDYVESMTGLGRGAASLATWLMSAERQWGKDHDPVESTVLAVARAINYGRGRLS